MRGVEILVLDRVALIRNALLSNTRQLVLVLSATPEIRSPDVR